MVMKVVKEDLSKILARADITESTQWLSVKKRKRGVFILFQALVKRLSSPAVLCTHFSEYSYSNDHPTPLVLDLHGWGGDAQNQIQKSPWQDVGAESNFMLLWPDGMGDMQSSLGSWNCSRTDGPKGKFY